MHSAEEPSAVPLIGSLCTALSVQWDIMSQPVRDSFR